MNDNIKFLLKYLRYHKRNLFIVFCALLIVAISLLQVGNVFRGLVDYGLSTNQSSSINNSIFLISMLIGIFAVGSFFRSYFINLITEKIISQIKSDSYKNLLQLEVATFEELKIGDIISRLSSDLESIGSLIANFLSFFIRNFIMLVGAIILMFLQSPKLSVLVVVSIPLLLMPLLRLSKNVRKLSKSVMTEKSDLSSYIEETFLAIRTLYAFNQQDYSAEKFNEKIHAYIKHSSKRLKLRSLFFALAIVVIAGSITMVIWVGSMDIINGKMTSGQMISFIYYSMIVGISAGGIAELFSDIQAPLAALERVSELRLLQNGNNLIERNYIDLKTVTPNYDISFENVKFAYPSRPAIAVLDNISFTIKHNQLTGIVGKSGSGKSTIMQLLLNFYQCQSGKISIANNDINSYAVKDIRTVIAYVQQDPAIFSGTIRSNIIFSNPYATEEDIKNIVYLCGIDKFIANLPKGLDTEIGEKGVRISGGQKQRLAIARALLYKPEILLLDEATSALDNESEEEILKNIKKFMRGKTIILIAHRISSTQEADRIIVVDQGKVVSFGTHQDLLKTCEIYMYLFNGAYADTKSLS